MGKNLDRLLIDLLRFAAARRSLFCKKWWTSSGTSSRRSRNGGISIGITASR